MQTSTVQYRKGCDPEIFLVNAITEKFISSVGLIGGTKDFPFPIGAGCAVQEDNVSVEFNTPACATAKEYIDAIAYNLDYIKERADSLGLALKITPSAVFDDDQLQTEAAQTFGCEPDYNAWNKGSINPKPRANNANLRSAGGHIHIELPEGTDILEVVKAMDLFVGCQMLAFDTDKGRRELYGKAGAFRKKSYGVEYRTASNAWIQSPERIQWVWDQTDKAVAFALSGITFTEEQGNKIQQCINTSDTTLLADLNEEFGL